MDNSQDEHKKQELKKAKEAWVKARQFMDLCRAEAEEFLNNNPRRKYYKVVYSICGYRKVIYVDFSDDDLREIREAFGKVIAEEGPFHNALEREDALTYCLDDADIYWECYLPEEDFTYVDERPIIKDIDLDDVEYFCLFKVLHTNWFEDSEKLVEKKIEIQMDDDTFVNLLAARLFDKRLSFYDLKFLNEDLYECIDGACSHPHEHHIIFMEEINEAARTILEKKKGQEISKHSLTGIYSILNNQEEFDDDYLLKAIQLLDCVE